MKESEQIAGIIAMGDIVENREIFLYESDAIIECEEITEEFNGVPTIHVSVNLTDEENLWRI